MMTVLAVAGIGFHCCCQHGSSTVAVLAVYCAQSPHCRWLKLHAIIDACVIATGFVLRIAAGGEATGIELSQWIVLMTFLLTLFLSFAKRRDDVLRMNATGEAPRKNTIRYNLTFINQAITITASVTLVCYIMYTVSPEVQSHFNAPHLYLTTCLSFLLGPALHTAGCCRPEEWRPYEGDVARRSHPKPSDAFGDSLSSS